jgi:UDP-glucose 4-epimerase
MGLQGVKRIYKPVLHGVGWPGDVKRIALKIERLKSLGWKPRLGSRKAVAEAAKHVLSEVLAQR